MPALQEVASGSRVNVSLAIMAHPSRQAWVDRLIDQLPEARVAWAQTPYATIDDQAPVWDTRKAALRLADGEYHCVLQDDVVLCPDFRERLTALCEGLGDRVAMLFYRHKRSAYPTEVQAAIENRRRGGFTTMGMVLGPGLVFPADRIADLIEHGDDGSTDGDDPRMQRWAMARGIETWIPLPSLVDHRHGPSLVGHSGWRRAWRFA